MYTSEERSPGQGREGRVATSDSSFDVSMTRPKELGGSGEGTNPEQLFASGYAACFHSALHVVARDRDHDLAQEFAEAAHLVYPYSNSIHGNIDVTVTVSND